MTQDETNAALIRLSASQVDVYRDCARKWAWHYLEGIREPPGTSLILGNRVHEIQAAWLRDGTHPDVHEVLHLPTPRGELKPYFPGQIAQAGWHLLPPPGVSIVESKIEFLTPSGQHWVGYVDALVARDSAARWQAPPHGAPVVIDHKTTSSFQWMKTADVLRTDVQAQLYAWAIMTAANVDAITLRWVYLLTSGRPQADHVEIVLDKNHVIDQIRSIDETAAEIQTLYALRPKALDLPPTISTCEKYGGCPHKERCGLTVADRVRAQMAQDSIKEMLERKMAERGVPANGAGHASPAPSYWKPGDPMNAAQAYLHGKGNALDIIAMAADVPPPRDVAAGYVQVPQLPPVPQITAPPVPPPAPPVPLAPFVPPPVETRHINPPEAPAHAPASPPVPATDVYDGMTRDQLKALAVQRGLVPTNSRMKEPGLKELLRKGAPALPPLPPIPPSPTTHEMYQKLTEVVSVDIPPTPVSSPLVTAPPRPAQGSLYILLENCTSIAGDATSFESILSHILPTLRQHTELADYRLEEYGRGPGRLAAAVEAYVTDPANPIDVISVDTRTPEGRDCIATLRRYAGQIIRSF